MNSDGEGVVAQERLIFSSYIFNNGLYVGRVIDEDHHATTISEVRNFIERHVENGTDHAIVSRLSIYSYDNGPRATEQESTLLGQSFQPLVHHLQELQISGNEWTDLERSCILGHASLQSSTIECIDLWGSAEMPITIRTLCNESPASLQTIELHDVVLTSVDCQLLGPMISNKNRALDCLILWYCSFPGLADFLTLIAGFVKDKIPSDRCDFWCCTVKDTCIPTHDGADYLEFGRIFGEFWQRRHGEPETKAKKATRLKKSADDMLNYFRPMQQAGLSSLLPSSQNTDSASVIETRQPQERREWVNLLGHEAVNDRVDLLFHILWLYPEVCVLG